MIRSVQTYKSTDGKAHSRLDLAVSHEKNLLETYIGNHLDKVLLGPGEKLQIMDLLVPEVVGGKGVKIDRKLAIEKMQILATLSKNYLDAAKAFEDNSLIEEF